jgi:hypothetical protein
VPVTDYTPTAAQVAANVMSRTRDSFGNLAGTFNANTTPTDTQVDAVVGAVINEVADEIGDDIPQPLFDDAASVVAKRAAMQVELDFFPEQVNTGRSIYPQLNDQYKTALASLKKQVVQIESGDTATVDAADVATGASMGGFPDSQCWDTRRW